MDASSTAGTAGIRGTQGARRHTTLGRLCALALSTAGLTVAGGAGAALPLHQGNPVWVPGMDAGGIGDPDIIKFRGKYYLYSSNDNYSGGAYSERVLAWESTDLVNWTLRGVAADYAQGWLGWAPDVLYYNGQFYMITSGDTLAGGRVADPWYPAYPPYYRDHVVLRSDSPTGPFTKIGDTLPGSIDGHLFLDDDGRAYFFWAAAGGIRYRAVNIAPSGITVDPAQPERQLTSCVVNIVSNWTEAPMVWKRNGTYYLSYSGNDVGRDDYQVNVCKGTSLPTLTRQSNHVLSLDTTGNWVGAAHSTMLTGPDLVTAYNAYHESDKTRRPGLYRNLALSEAWIGSDGELHADAPEAGFDRPAQPLFRDDFNRAAIGAGWQQIGTSSWGLWNSELLWNDSLATTGWQLQTTTGAPSPADYVYEGSARLWQNGTRSPSHSRSTTTVATLSGCS